LFVRYLICLEDSFKNICKKPDLEMNPKEHSGGVGDGTEKKRVG
jgi:hypothetical protein